MFRSTLAEVITCCLTAPSHYLNQCWHITKGVMWFSPQSNSTSAHELNLLYVFRERTFKNNTSSPRGQRVKAKLKFTYLWCHSDGRVTKTTLHHSPTKMKIFIKQIQSKQKLRYKFVDAITGWETRARPLDNASENLAGRVENRPGRVEFCIGYIRDYPVPASAKKF